MENRLILIKLIHSVIWLILASATFYILFSGVCNRITIFTWIAICMIVGEGILLLLFRWSCPLTGIARKYSDSTRHNFDIYLPEWLARHNKTIFTIIFLAGVISVLFRIWNK